MGLSDWFSWTRTEADASATAAEKSKVSSAKWQVVEGIRRSKSDKKKHFGALRLQGYTAQNAKDLVHQTVVTKLYPAMVQLRLQRPFVPSTWKDCGRKKDDVVSTKSKDDENERDQQQAVHDYVSPKWLATEASIRFQEEVAAAMASGACQFQMTSDGCGGVYFLHVSGDRSKTAPLGIFKPRDEEYMGPKNPRGYVKENAVVGETEHPVNKGFRVGNGALRERAAYLLDESYGNFSGVPVTNLMVLPINGDEKEGSMQRFVPSECSAEDMGTLKFAVPEVHKIGILDVRLFNTDRHAGNILLTSRPNEQTYAMTPIDHGFCLPSYKCLDGATFDWLQWPQAQFPFTSTELEHIESLNVDRDAAILRSLGIEEECVTTMRLCTTVLQVGADVGCSLFEIASCLQRDGDFSSPSTFEDIVTEAVTTVEENLGLSEQQNEREFYDALVTEVKNAAVELFENQPKKKVRSISCFS